MKVYPNPAQSFLKLDIEVDKSDMYQFQLMGLDGKEVLTISNISLTPGLNEVEIDISSIANGMYLVRLVTGSHQYVERVSVVK
jgi:hypothetical protein